MNRIHISRTIAAPAGLVFQTVSDVRNFREAVPHITHVEFLSDQQSGAGTRFRETRVMHGRKQTVELEVAEYMENDRVRMVSDAGGATWDTMFSVSACSDRMADMAILEMEMEITPRTLLARLMTPLIRGMVVKGVEADMDAVKACCEFRHEQARQADSDQRLA